MTNLFVSAIIGDKKEVIIVVKKFDDEVINIYDKILSGLPHVSSLNIKEKNVKSILEYSSFKDYKPDTDILDAHKRIIGEVVLTSLNDDILSIRNFIMLPDFSVKTYVPNGEYYYQDTYSLEKSVLIGKKSELNVIINNPDFVRENSKRLLVLSIERVEFSFGMDYFLITYKEIPSALFYEYYTRLVLPYKKYRFISDDEYMRIKNQAIRDVLNVLGDAHVRIDGEFTLNSSNYPLIKNYLKSKYNLDYNDEFISINGENVSIWNDLGVGKYDNRALMEGQESVKPYPLAYQRNLQLRH